MGFFDAVGKGISAAGKSMDNLNREMAKYLERYQNLSREQLMEKYNSMFATTGEKMAIKKIMRDRGWS
ncbi:MAG: hypothetical protein Q4F72_11165 [Desulfovibrionaceae bacterium]|nr:hypothetical protein [Desulfovibrionaceae bacterium]